MNAPTLAAQDGTAALLRTASWAMVIVAAAAAATRAWVTLSAILIVLGLALAVRWRSRRVATGASQMTVSTPALPISSTSANRLADITRLQAERNNLERLPAGSANRDVRLLEINRELESLLK